VGLYWLIASVVPARRKYIVIRSAPSPLLRSLPDSIYSIMSLPRTQTQISERPGTMGVTVAASGAEMESDVQRKMKLWGVIEAFRDG
jgi:hypothetical protein